MKLTKRSKIIIICALALALMIAAITLTLVLVFTSTTTLGKLYSKNKLTLEKAGYSGEILQLSTDIDSFIKEQKLSIVTSTVAAVFKCENSAMYGVEFVSRPDADQFFKQDIGYKSIQQNVVMFSASRYMSGLLLGEVFESNGGYIYTDNESGKTTLLMGTNLADVDVIGYRAFASSALTEIDIPDNITEIAPQAFFGASNLARIGFQNSSRLKVIDEYAFANCKSLTQITLPNDVDSVGSYAFYGNDKMTRLEVCSKLSYLGNNALQGCAALSDIIIYEDCNYYVEDGALYSKGGELVRLLDSGGTTFEIGATINSVGGSAFEGKIKLANVTTASGAKIKNIGSNAFENCIRLTDAPILSDCESIGQNAFTNTKLGSATFSSSIKNIGNGAFRQTHIREIILPRSLESIGDYAFKDSQYLRKIIVQADKSLEVGREAFNGIYRIFLNNQAAAASFSEYENSTYSTEIIKGDYAVELCDDGVEVVQYLGYSRDVTVPKIIGGKKVISIGENAFARLDFLYSVNFEEGSYVSELGGTAIEGCPNLTSLKLPYGIKTLGTSSIRNNPKLEQINVPSTVNTIRAWALDQTKWLNDKSGMVMVGDNIMYKYIGNETEITLPSGTKTVGVRSFMGKSNLKKVTLPSSIKNIDEYAFYATGIENITLNEGLEQIHSLAFGACEKLKSITIPESVFYLGYGVFYKIYLESVTFLTDTPFSISTDVFAFPQNKAFKINVPSGSICASKTGVCQHIKGKSSCFKHANRWTAFRNVMAGY